MPVQLLILHFRKNQLLLICWLFLFLIVGSRFGTRLGIPYLFLDPEYLNEVSFTSFIIMGVVLAGFSTAYNITSYILDSVRFNFIAAIAKPFTHFSINNSLIPISFLIFYIAAIVQFQAFRGLASTSQILIYIGGLLTGYLLMIVVLYVVFWFTNNDIFNYVVVSVDKNIREKIGVSRGNILARISVAKKKKKQSPVKSYISTGFKINTTPQPDFYAKETLTRVFDQNHLNLVLVQLFIFALLMVLGIFRDFPAFQIPAAASAVLILTVAVMLVGALSFWFRGWTTTVVVILLVVLNFLIKEEVLKKQYYAYGLNYEAAPADYSQQTLKDLSNPDRVFEDKAEMYQVLENWRSKFDHKPVMILISVSGGGQRAALWTVKTLQTADSLTNGALMKHTMMISGASGGLIGASYFRELYRRRLDDPNINLNSPEYLKNISNDNLNPIIFSLLVNDLFVNSQYFTYNSLSYPKDRGYAFEQQLNVNTGRVLDHKVSDYYDDEHESRIPLMLMAPTIINDGRKLFISSHGVSFMSTTIESNAELSNPKIKGVDFNKLFKNQGAGDLRFLSALRMSATFPYVTPNITLPSSPPMEIMDAGISDNFGVDDATRFLYSFRDWIAENTSGVVLLTIRDSSKENEIMPRENLSLFENISTPIASVYSNLANLQDLNNDGKIEFARSWFRGPLNRIDIQYVPEDSYVNLDNLPDDQVEKIRQELKRQRATLSWRLTNIEKQNIIDNISSPSNTVALKRLTELIQKHSEQQGQN